MQNCTPAARSDPMLKLAHTLILSVAVLAVSQPAPAHAGREMRAIKAAGLKDEYKQVRRQVKLEMKDDSHWKALKVTVASGGLAGVATMLLNHFAFGHFPISSPALLIASGKVALAAGVIFGTLELGRELVHKVSKSFKISREARRRVIAANNLVIR
jgi:hypothetical protein